MKRALIFWSISIAAVGSALLFLREERSYETPVSIETALIAGPQDDEPGERLLAQRSSEPRPTRQKLSSVKPSEALERAAKFIAKAALPNVPGFQDAVERIAFSPSEESGSSASRRTESSVETERGRDRGEQVRSFLSGIIGAARANPARRPGVLTDLPQAELNQRYCQKLPLESGTGRITQGFAPKGLLLDRTKLTLCGTPTETGIFRFAVLLEDSGGRKENYQFKLVVSEGEGAETDEPVRVISNQLDVGKIGAEYQFQLRVQGGKPPFVWSAGGLPDGLEIDPASGIIGGSPAEDGEFSITIRVSDRADSADTKSLPLVVRVTPLWVTTRSLGEGIVGERYQTRLTAQGGKPPYRWEISALPKGLELNPVSGEIDGVPTEPMQGAVRARVIDSEEERDSADLALEIHASTLIITSNGMTDGFTGRSYAFQFVAQGGVAPYQWRSGVLPGGLFLEESGRVIGEPHAKGEFRVTVTVDDSLGDSASRTFRVRIQSTEEEEELNDVVSGTTVTTLPVTTLSSVPISGGNAPAALPGISQFAVVPSDGKAGLVWRNPNHPDFVEAVVVRSPGAFPESPDAGTTIYRGALENHLDTKLENGSIYYYTVFADYGERGVGEILDGAQGLATPQSLSLDAKPDPFADAVLSFKPLDPKCYNCNLMPGVILGTPQGKTGGATDSVVSIGARVNGDSAASAPYGGSVTIEFIDNIIVDGPGWDFTVFENAFQIPGTTKFFVEPSVVEVSVDGEHFYRFPFDFVPHYDEDNKLNLLNPQCYAKGFAGIEAVYSNGNMPSPLNTVLSGGDKFDLADLPGTPLSWARFVRITSTGDAWLLDEQGDLVRHSHEASTWAASGKGNSGSDIDAVVAVNF